MGVKDALGFLPDRLCPLTLFTSFDVFSDVLHDPWPPVVPGNQLMCLVPSRVSSQRGVVVKSDDVLPQLGILWHIHPVFPRDDVIIMLVGMAWICMRE